VDDLFTNGYYDEATRVFILSFAFYHKITDYFIAMQILVEFLPSGQVYPSHIKILPFRPNIFEDSEEKFLQACDIFRFMLCLYLLYMVY
jgi:hypothetical protein